MAVPKVQFTPGPLKVASPFDLIQQVLPDLVTPDGVWTPYKGAARLFDTIEIRTRVTPPIIIDVADLEDPTPNPLLAALAPAVIMRGPLGTNVIAPYGEVPDGSGGVVGIAVVAGAGLVSAGIGAALGYWLGRRSKRGGR